MAARVGASRSRPTRPECRSASSRCELARAAPGSPAGRRRRRAGGSRTSGAGRAARRRPDAAAARPDAQPAPHVARSTAAGRTSTGTARSPRLGRRAPGGRAPGSASIARSAGSPTGHDARLPALALDAHLLAVEVHDADVEVHELLGAQAAGVGELEHRAVAQLERRRGGDAVEQRGDLAGVQHARQVRRRFGAAAARPGSARPRRARAACRRARAATASLRATVVGAVAARGQLGGVAAQRRGVDVVAARARAPSPSARTGRRRPRRRGACAPRRRGGAGRHRAGAARAPGSALGARVSSAPMAAFFIDTSTGQVATVGSSSRPGSPTRRRRRRARGTGSRARATPRRCGTRCCAGGRRGSSSARWFFATPTTMPLCCERGWEEIPVDETARSRARRR